MLVKKYAKLGDAQADTINACTSCDANLFCLDRVLEPNVNYCAHCHKYWIDIISNDPNPVGLKLTSIIIARHCPNISETMVEDRILEFKLFKNSLIQDPLIWENGPTSSKADTLYNMTVHLVTTCLCSKCAEVEAKEAHRVLSRL